MPMAGAENHSSTHYSILPATKRLQTTAEVNGVAVEVPCENLEWNSMTLLPPFYQWLVGLKQHFPHTTVRLAFSFRGRSKD